MQLGLLCMSSPTNPRSQRLRPFLFRKDRVKPAQMSLFRTSTCMTACMVTYLLSRPSAGHIHTVPSPRAPCHISRLSQAHQRFSRSKPASQVHAFTISLASCTAALSTPPTPAYMQTRPPHARTDSSLELLAPVASPAAMFLLHARYITSPVAASRRP